MPGLPLLHPTDVQLQANLQAAIFLSETALTLEKATGQVEAEIPIAPILTPFQHGKPFVTEEEEKSLGTFCIDGTCEYRMTKGKYLESSIVTMISSAGRAISGCTSKIYITFIIDKPSTPLSSPFGFCKYHLPLH